jgi:excinuclease ABC subunit A
VGTVTEIYDYLRLLWARIGVPHCPKCGKEIRRQTVDQIVDRIMELPEHTRVQILAPVIRSKKGEHRQILEDARRSGYVRAVVDGVAYGLEEEITLKKNVRHNIDIVIDRLVIRENIVRRLTDSVETALRLADGIVCVDLPDREGEMLSFSQNFACDDCGISLGELTPAMFSFNNPAGACPKCSGLGTQMLINPDLIIPNPDLSINEGAIAASGWNNVKNDSISKMYFEALAKRFKFKLSDPVRKIPEEGMQAILYGTDGEKLRLKYEKADGFGVINREFEGIVNNLTRRYAETQSQSIRSEIEESMSETSCPLCGGKRLKDIALAVTVFGKSIYEFTQMPVTDALEFMRSASVSEKDRKIADRILREIRERLQFLVNVGLGYLSLSRAASTLSGGESQRIRLATQIGSGLTGVLYILDEPSIGLHQVDNRKLIRTLMNLRDQGNTLIVVEHDEETIRTADYIVDMGPGAGNYGGEVVCAGTVEDILQNPESITGQYLRGEKSISVPSARRKGNGKQLILRGAAENNLKCIDVAFPLEKLICVTGVSGSGKSSLVNEILYKVLANKKNHAKLKAGKYQSIEGLENVDKVIVLDQSPIGRTPRSNPATYTGVFTDIRDLFASTNDAKMRGYGTGRFSFNVKGGRCEACQGDGLLKIEMNFLPDVFVPCEVCHGKRYNRETLEVRYKNKNIADILDMTVSEACDFFANQPRILNKIRTLFDVGLGYIRLGQSSTTLSGGEAQRVKLAAELSRPDTGSTVYILDEPTTGLHTDDVSRLVTILDRLVDAGNTVIVIEHNLDVIKVADHIIDLGPEGGDRGGNIVFQGTPEACARCESSYTGAFLEKILNEE